MCGCVSSQGLRRVYMGVFFPLCAWKAAKDEVAVMKMAFFPEIKALKRGNKKRVGMKVAFEDLSERSGHKVSSSMRRKEKGRASEETQKHRTNSCGDVHIFYRLGICCVTESTNFINNFRVDAIFVTN